VDLGPRSRADPPGKRLGRAVQAHGHRHQPGRIHPSGRVVLDRRPQARRRAQDADRRDVTEDQVAAVDQARHARDTDADQPPARLSQRQRVSGHPRIVGGIDHRVVARRRRIPTSPVRARPERRSHFLPPAIQRQHMHRGTRRGRERGGQQPDGARPADQDPLPGPGPGGGGSPPGVTSRLDHRAGPVVDRVRQPVQAGRGHHDLLGQRPRPAHDADLVPVRADVPAPRPAPGAPPAPEHGVPGHPGAQPLIRDSGRHCRHHTTPLVPRPHRKPCLPLPEVGHLTGKQLDVRAADPGSEHVHDHLPRPGHRRFNLRHVSRAGTVDHQRAHNQRFPPDQDRLRASARITKGSHRTRTGAQRP